MSDQAVFEIQPHDRALLIAVQKSVLDDVSSELLFDGVLTAAAETPHLPIVIDLSRVRFAPSVALGSLVRLSSSFKIDGRRIAVIGMNSRLREAVRVTQLHKVLEIRDTLEQVIGRNQTQG